MRVAIVTIGNSKGIRIPKALLQQCGFEDSADLSVENGRLIVQAVRPARQGWDDAFKQFSQMKRS